MEIDMDIKDRINLLQRNGVISEETSSLAQKAIEWLSARGIDLEKEQTHMFLTHLVMALERKNRGEEVDDAVPSYMIEEAKASKGYYLAKDFLKFIEEENGVILPESEKVYILFHLCVLNKKEEKDD
jgi:hypothetical protein